MAMSRAMDGEDLLQAQRRLRSRLLEGRGSTLPGAQALAAHMLVYLDDEAHCWQLMLDWLRATFDADRASGGLAGPAQALYVAQAEALRPGGAMPSALGTTHDAREGWLAGALGGAQPVVFGDVAHDARFAPGLRRQLLATGTRAQLALVLRAGRVPVGLVLCGWRDARPGWTPPRLGEVDAAASAMLGPILAVAARLGRRRPVEADDGAAGHVREHRLVASLTPAELDVARLVVTGMSYKEIAHRLNRSFSTVDHRLRAIREKLGARSTARMVALLADLLDAPQRADGSAREYAVAARGAAQAGHLRDAALMD